VFITEKNESIIIENRDLSKRLQLQILGSLVFANVKIDFLILIRNTLFGECEFDYLERYFYCSGGVPCVLGDIFWPRSLSVDISYDEYMSVQGV
jgi:hypothetical protein